MPSARPDNPRARDFVADELARIDAGMDVAKLDEILQRAIEAATAATTSDIEGILTDDEALVAQKIRLLKKDLRFLRLAEKKIKSEHRDHPIDEAGIQRLKDELADRIQRLDWHGQALRRRNMSSVNPEWQVNRAVEVANGESETSGATVATPDQTEQKHATLGKKVDDLVEAADKLLEDHKPDDLGPEEIDAHRYAVIDQLDTLKKAKEQADEVNAKYEPIKARKVLARLRARRNEMKRQAESKSKAERDAEEAGRQAEVQRLETRKNELTAKMLLEGELARQRVEDAAPIDIMNGEQLEIYAAHLKRHDKKLRDLCDDAKSIDMPVPDELKKQHRAVKQMRKKVLDLGNKLAKEADERRRQELLDQALAPLRQLVAENERRWQEEARRRQDADEDYVEKIEDEAREEADRIRLKQTKDTLKPIAANLLTAVDGADRAMQAECATVEGKINALTDPTVKNERLNELELRRQKWRVTVAKLKAELADMSDDIEHAEDILLLVPFETSLKEKGEEFNRYCENFRTLLTQFSGRIDDDKAAEPITVEPIEEEVPEAEEAESEHHEEGGHHEEESDGSHHEEHKHDGAHEHTHAPHYSTQKFQREKDKAAFVKKAGRGFRGYALKLMRPDLFESAASHAPHNHESKAEPDKHEKKPEAEKKEKHEEKKDAKADAHHAKEKAH